MGKTGELKSRSGAVKLDRYGYRVRQCAVQSDQETNAKRACATPGNMSTWFWAGRNRIRSNERQTDQCYPWAANFYTRIEHPGAKPRPFMEQAADASFHMAVRAFESKLEERINVEQNKLKARNSVNTASLAAMRDFF